MKLKYTATIDEKLADLQLAIDVLACAVKLKSHVTTNSAIYRFTCPLSFAVDPPVGTTKLKKHKFR